MGTDRRGTNKFRWFDKRRRDLSAPLPPAQIMLRQLHLRVLDLTTAREAIAVFRRRVELTVDALREEGQADAAVELEDIGRALASASAAPRLAPAMADAVQQSAAKALMAVR